MAYTMIDDLEYELMSYCVSAAGHWWNHIPFCRTRKITALYIRLRREPSHVVRRIVATRDHEAVLEDVKAIQAEQRRQRPARRVRRKK